MNHIHDEALKARYRAAFSRVYAPADAGNRVLERLVPRSRNAGRRLCLALCLVLALTGAAVAQVNGDWLGALINLSGREAPALTAIHQTQENDDARWTLESAVSDGTRLYLLMEVESLNGQSLTPDEFTALELSLLLDAEIARGDDHSQGLGLLRLDDGADPLRASLALTFTLEPALQPGEQLTLILKDLDLCSDGDPTAVPRMRASEVVATGPWSFSFQLQQLTEVLSHPLGNHMVNISPLGITIESLWSDYSLEGAHLVLADGSTVQLLDAGSASATYTDANIGRVISHKTTASFDRLISPEEAVTLVIGDMSYPLNTR